MMKTSGILVSTCFLLWMVGLGTSVSEGQQPDSLADQVNLELRPDVRVFAVMAALNAAGFDYEAPDETTLSLRLSLRRDLEKADPVLLEELRNFFQDHRGKGHEADEQIAYTSLALLLSDPPEFKINVTEREIPQEVQRIRGFEQLVERLYRSANLATLWTQYQPAYQADLQTYLPVVRALVAETLEYFRIPPRIALDRQIILIPDLLNAKEMVNARNLDRTYYIVVGPTDSARANYQQLQHEYLHFLIDPLLEKYGMSLLEHADLVELANSQPNLKTEYRNKFFLVLAESLIESVLMRLHPTEDLEGVFLRRFREGLIFLPFFYRGLERYETETELISFPAFVEILFDEIKDSEIKSDDKSLTALEKESQQDRDEEASREQQRRQENERRNQITALLNEGIVLLTQKQYPLAGEKLNQVLQEDPGNGSAYFYLAQLASQTDQYEQAHNYYTKAIGVATIPDWIRAWSLVRIGNYHAFRGQSSQALGYFRRVLGMAGELRGAQEAAQKSSDRLAQEGTR